MPIVVERRLLRQRCSPGFKRVYSGKRKLGICRKGSGKKLTIKRRSTKKRSGKKASPKRRSPKKRSGKKKSGKKASPKRRRSTKRKTPKKSGAKRKRKSAGVRPVKKSSPYRSYRIGRPSPNYSATTFPRGTVRRGGDGNLWRIAISSNGVRRWQRT